MTINFLDLYNDVASQPWSMFDSGAITKDDFENALVSSINKAIIDVWYSYPFSFRIKNYSFFTMNNYKKYLLPNGNIINQSSIEDNLFAIKLNQQYLNYNPDIDESSLTGIPVDFSIQDDSIILFPTPNKKYRVSLKYLTLSIGFDSSQNEIFYLENTTDYIDIPQKYETIFKNVIIAKSMMNSMSSINDEHYIGYNSQFEKNYKLLVKISNPTKKSMSVTF